MDPTQPREANTSMQPHAKDPARFYLHTRSSQMEDQSLGRPLRSHSRKHRIVHLARRNALLSTPTSSDDSIPSLPRLRRTQAFSDLVRFVSSSFDPVVSVFVAKDDWLNHSIAKTKKLIGDKETAEQMGHRVHGAPSIEYLDFSEHPPKLRRKSKSEDLRTEYEGDDSDEGYSPSVPSSPCSSDRNTTPNSVQDYTTSDAMSSDNSSFDHAQVEFICGCGQACKFCPGELLLCAACGDWISTGCAEKGAEGVVIPEDADFARWGAAFEVVFGTR